MTRHAHNTRWFVVPVLGRKVLHGYMEIMEHLDCLDVLPVRSSIKKMMKRADSTRLEENGLLKNGLPVPPLDYCSQVKELASGTRHDPWNLIQWFEQYVRDQGVAELTTLDLREYVQDWVPSNARPDGEALLKKRLDPVQEDSTRSRQFANDFQTLYRVYQSKAFVMNAGDRKRIASFVRKHEIADPAKYVYQCFMRCKGDPDLSLFISDAWHSSVNNGAMS